MRLEMELFFQEYVSLIQFLSTIFTMAVGRILTNNQQYILLCLCHRDPNNFWPKWIPSIISCMMHPATTSQLLFGSYIKTLLWGFLSAGLQNNPTERKPSHVTKRIKHIFNNAIY
jgi:hypothetical protein